MPRTRGTVPTRAGLVLLCSAALLAPGLGGVNVHGQTRSLPAEQSIDPAQLLAPEPQFPGPDNPAQEEALQKLRATASAATPAAPRQPRASDEPTPRDAAWLLGLLALHGRAMPVDPPQARKWFERAHLLGHPLAPAGLAWCQIDGCSSPPNPAAARPWIAQLRAVDRGRALYLEWMVETRLAPLRIAQVRFQDKTPVPESLPHRGILVRAAQAGDANALNELGLDAIASGRLPQALESFRRAAARSPAAAANAQLLSSRMQTTFEPQPHRHTADQWFLEARRYHRGDGVPANYTEAIRLYQVASASGSRAAQHMLERIYSRPGADGAIDIAWMQQLANLNITLEGAVLSTLPSASPQLFVRDPTPLYDLLPQQWRAPGAGAQR